MTPFTAVIAGKRHNLKNRKFCLECSPSGLHNTRELYCANCHRELEDSLRVVLG